MPGALRKLKIFTPGRLLMLRVDLELQPVMALVLSDTTGASTGGGSKDTTPLC
eukprot:GSA25T00003472001.1